MPRGNPLGYLIESGKKAGKKALSKAKEADDQMVEAHSRDRDMDDGFLGMQGSDDGPAMSLGLGEGSPRSQTDQGNTDPSLGFGGEERDMAVPDALGGGEREKSDDDPFGWI